MNSSIIVNNRKGIIAVTKGVVGFYDRVEKYGFWISGDFEFNTACKAEASNFFAEFEIDCTMWPTKFFPRSFIFEIIDSRKLHQSIPLLKTVLGLPEKSTEIALMKAFVTFCNLSETQRIVKRDLRRWYNRYSRLRWRFDFLSEVPNIAETPTYESEFTQLYIKENSIFTFHFVRGQANLFICENAKHKDSCLDQIFSNWKFDLKIRVLDKITFNRLAEDICLDNFSLLISGEKMDAADAYHNTVGKTLKIKDPAIAFLHKKMSNSYQMNQSMN